MSYENSIKLGNCSPLDIRQDTVTQFTNVRDRVRGKDTSDDKHKDLHSLSTENIKMTSYRVKYPNTFLSLKTSKLTDCTV